MRRAGWLAATLLLGVGCAPTPVEVDLRFPNERSFLLSDRGRLLVYEVDPETGLGDCPALVEAAVQGEVGEPTLDSTEQDICEFHDPGVGFDDMPPGPHAFVVFTQRDDPSATLLAGCRIAEAYVDAPPIEITMFPTPMYTDATDGLTSTCTLESKCNGSCQ